MPHGVAKQKHWKEIEQYNQNQLKDVQQLQSRLELIQHIHDELQQIVFQYQDYIVYEKETLSLDFHSVTNESFSFDGLSKKESDKLYKQIQDTEEDYLDRIQYLSIMNDDMIQRFNDLYVDIKQLYEEVEMKLQSLGESKRDFEFDIERSVNRLLEITKMKSDSDIKYYEDQIRLKKENLVTYQKQMTSFRERNEFLNVDQLEQKAKVYHLDAEVQSKIEDWTKMTFNKVIFDSKKHSYNQKTSVFDNMMMNKKNITIVIETTIDNQKIHFGMCIFKEIDKLFTKVGTSIMDENCFVFTFQKNKVNQYCNKINLPFAINLYPQDHECLFQLGMEIKVSKNLMITYIQSKQSVFDYGFDANALLPKSGIDFVKADRVMVYQMI